MSEIEIERSFSTYYNNAVNYKQQLDRTSHYFDNEFASLMCKDHILDKIENPTIANVAMRKYVKRNPYQSKKKLKTML